MYFLIGVYASRRVQATAHNKFLQEYFLGGRELGGLLLAMTMIATYGSASSFIGGPGIAYNMGLGWVLLSAIQVVTGYIVLTVIGKKFAIIARKMEAITLIDYLKGRYNNKAVVILSALCIIIFLFSATVAQWVGGGRLIESLTGLSYTTALFLFTFFCTCVRINWWISCSCSIRYIIRNHYVSWNDNHFNCYCHCWWWN